MYDMNPILAISVMKIRSEKCKGKRPDGVEDKNMLHVYVQIQQNKIYNILYKKW